MGNLQDVQDEVNVLVASKSMTSDFWRNYPPCMPEVQVMCKVPGNYTAGARGAPRYSPPQKSWKMQQGQAETVYASVCTCFVHHVGTRIRTGFHLYVHDSQHHRGAVKFPGYRFKRAGVFASQAFGVSAVFDWFGQRGSLHAC